MTTPLRPLHLARLVGTQAEMGAQHGRLVAADARRLLEFYRTMPERQLAGGDTGLLGVASRALVRRVADAWQARLARSRPAELAARSRAFVLAAGGQASDAQTFATMDAMQNCVSLAARAGLGPFARPLTARLAAAAQPACSTVIAWGAATEDGELLFARNFDFPGVGVWDAAPAFTLCAPRGGLRYGFFAARGVDAPVVTVVNEAGLVLAPHTRWHRGVTWSGAMIVDLVHDIARRAETLADALALARERPPSSSWGIAVGSAREKSACVIEAAGALVEVVRPAPGADHLVCTNRYRSPALQAGQVAGSEAWALHADRRERRLRTLVDRTAAPFGAAAGRGQAPPGAGTAAPFGAAAGRGQAPPGAGTAAPFGAAAGRGHAPPGAGTAAPFGAAAGRGHAPPGAGTAAPFGAAAGRGQAPPGVTRTAPLSPRALAALLADRHDAAAPELRRHLGAIPAQPTNVHAAVVRPSARQAWVGVDRAPCCEGAWAHVAWAWEGAAGGWELGDAALAGAGFTAELVPDFAPPQDAATRAVHDAVCAYDDTHDVPAARAALERAVAAAPDDPSLRLAATWLALEAGAPAAALAHADAGLAHEHEPYRRAQLLLWAARAAPEPARYTAELATLRGAGIADLVAASRRRWRGVPHANLMMHDAY